jgi:hypothetical protein
MVQKMAAVLQNQFGLKPKLQGQVYTPPFPEWYHRVALPPRVKPPADFTKFSGQDDTSTMEHIAPYLMQLGEPSADEAIRIRYFPLSLTGPTFIWFASLPAQSICSWKDLEQKFHAHYFISSSEKKLIDLTTLRQRHNETPMEFLRRFRETKGMCYSLNLPKVWELVDPPPGCKPIGTNWVWKNKEGGNCLEPNTREQMPLGSKIHGRSLNRQSVSTVQVKTLRIGGKTLPLGIPTVYAGQSSLPMHPFGQ